VPEADALMRSHGDQHGVEALLEDLVQVIDAMIQV
jgi:hypothetical protein